MEPPDRTDRTDRTDRPSPPATASAEAEVADAMAALFARQPNRMVPDLDRITTLVELLGRPDLAHPCVHVSGTNGKTTTTRMIAALFGALGLTAGSYTSPHLQDVRERICVADDLISAEALLDALRQLEPYLAEVDARHPDRVTFFEVLTAVAHMLFADAPVDLAVYEVGMGGRWDATNTVRGEVAVLGPITLDHPELGASVAEIAMEKAGIIKPGATVVSSEQDPAVLAVLQRAASERDARLLLAGRDFGVERRQLAVGGQLLALRTVSGTVEEVYLPLHGRHQAGNAAVALTAVDAFLGFSGSVDPEVIRTGFAAVRSPGRLEVVRRVDAATVVLDGAHNPAGVAALATALREEFAFRHRVMVVGVLADKDIEHMVEGLLEVADHIVVTELDSPRAAPAERIAGVARAFGRSVEVFPDVASALDAASGLAGEEDGVVVTGSLHTVGAARTALGLDPDAR